MGKRLCWIPFLMKLIAGINSRLASLVKKSLQQRHLPVNTLELSVLLQEGLAWAPLHELRFFHKTAGCVLRGCNFINKLVHHRLLSQNIVF